MRVALVTLVITATVDFFILFILANRGTAMSGVMLLLPAIYLGGASLVTALALCLVRYVSPSKLGRGIVLQAFAIAFFFLQFALVREASAHLMKNDVQDAKAYCSLVIEQLKRDSEGKYPPSLADMKLAPSIPRLLSRRQFYTTSEDQREYELSFSWDFEYAWVYSSKYGQWRFHS